MTTAISPINPDDDENRFRSARNPKGKKPVSDQAVSNKLQRINVPFYPSAWDSISTLNEDGRNLLRWLHGHVLESEMGRGQVSKITGIHESNSSRILRGDYNGDWPKIVERVRTYKATLENASLPSGEITMTKNRQYKRIREGLDFALFEHEFSLIIGDSGSGKTSVAEDYAREHYGNVYMLRAPLTGGAPAFLRTISQSFGHGRKRAGIEREIAIKTVCAQNPDAMFIIDQADRIIPNTRARALETGMKYVNSAAIEFLMDIVDLGMGVALLLTRRGSDHLEAHRDNKNGFAHEQIIRRALPLVVPDFSLADVRPIIRQFGTFGAQTEKRLLKIAQESGKLGIMIKALKAARLYCERDKRTVISDSDITGAINYRRNVITENQPLFRD